MTKQKTTNIRLLYLLVGAVAVSMLISFMTGDSSDNLDVDRAFFRLSNTLEINKVLSRSGGEVTNLEYTGGKWILNDEFEADPSRVHLLFAALQNVSIRRPVSPGQIRAIDSLFNASSSIIEFYADDQLLNKIETIGDFENGITYFRNTEAIYLMEIPGYRTYIHGLIAIDSDSWRNKNLFHKMNWRNLGKVSVMFPFSPGNNYSISRKNQLFAVDQLTETDTTKLFDFIDYISLMEAEKYLEDTFKTIPIPEIVIDVRDVGNRGHIMELFDLDVAKNSLLGRMDSIYYFSLGREQFNSLLLSRKEFEK